MSRRCHILLVLLIAGSFPDLTAQPVSTKNAYRIVGTEIVLHLKRDWPRRDQEGLLKESGMVGLSLDTLWKFGSLGHYAKEGWLLTGNGKDYRIHKSISELSRDVKWDSDNTYIPGEFYEKIIMQTTATFGMNSFRSPSVIQLPNGMTRFFLAGNINARDAYLSGTFNDWSTIKNKMIPTDSGWICDVVLWPGKHVYKYIVGGHWKRDLNNNLMENDFYGGDNSIYYSTNYTFRLTGYGDAKNVYITGSFNNWREHSLKMRRVGSGWVAPVFLRNGVYEYKFLVDENWITDPANPDVRTDRGGNKNSLLSIGEQTIFTLKSFTNVRKVILSGEFNNWNEQATAMSPLPTGWKTGLTLPPGNYQYKFIADGKWMTDPENPHRGTLHGQENSVVSIQPNHTFALSGFTDAHVVSVAGNFNGWQGYTMARKNGGWTIDVYLPPGKCLYKFIIDGKWIIDPANKLYEENRYHTGNSLLWMAPR